MKWYAVVGIVVLAMMAGCTSDPAPTAREGTYGCGPVSVDKWAAADPKTPDEPTLRLPQPPNWKRVNFADSAVTHLMVRDDNAGTEPLPSVDVWVADRTGRAQSPQAVFDTERNGLNTSGATDIADVTGTVCGFQSHTFNYQINLGAATPGKVQSVVVAPQYNDKLFEVKITVQNGNSGNQGDVKDTQTILTGLELKAPTPH